MTTIFYEARVYHAVDMFAEANNLRYYWVATIRVPRALRYPTINNLSVVHEILEDVYKTTNTISQYWGSNYDPKKIIGIRVGKHRSTSVNDVVELFTFNTKNVLPSYHSKWKVAGVGFERDYTKPLTEFIEMESA
tara:strand:+ start:2599 stop:3003 length:405 start_codon:yes stop_codon:yes gene_type:complete